MLGDLCENLSSLAECEQIGRRGKRGKNMKITDVSKNMKAVISAKGVDLKYRLNSIY